MQEAQLVIEQLMWLTNLSENIVKNQNIIKKLHKSAENRYIYYSAPVN
jgi:hypothetical protein